MNERKNGKSMALSHMSGFGAGGMFKRKRNIPKSPNSVMAPPETDGKEIMTLEVSLEDSGRRARKNKVTTDPEGSPKVSSEGQSIGITESWRRPSNIQVDYVSNNSVREVGGYNRSPDQNQERDMAEVNPTSFARGRQTMDPEEGKTEAVRLPLMRQNNSLGSPKARSLWGTIVRKAKKRKKRRRVLQELPHTSHTEYKHTPTPVSKGSKKVNNSMDLFDSSVVDESYAEELKHDLPTSHLGGSYAFQHRYTKENSTKQKWLPYAHNLSYLTGLFYLFFGGVAIFWRIWINRSDILLPDNVEQFIVSPVLVGEVVFFIGLIMLLNERLMTGRAGYKAFGYIVSSVPAFFSYATILPGVVSVFCGFVYFLAHRNGEAGTVVSAGYVVSSFNWDADMGVYYLSMTFIALNVAVFTYLWIQTEILVILCFEDEGNQAALLCPSQAAPFAKGFGNMLNLDCALVVIPVLRYLLTDATERFNKNNRIPIRKSIELHQVVGAVIGVATIGHTVSHYINYGLASEITILAFGKSAWYTGAAIVFTMVVLYSAAHHVVRQTNYEVFWHTHHIYNIFFLLLLAHSPRFWQWFFIPVILLTAEKVKRHSKRLNRVTFVRSVDFNDPVLNLNFSFERQEDFVFKEGQYCYLLCPQVNEYEWHPFSISSCFGDLKRFGYMSLHIRVQDDVNSWTYMLKEYFKEVAGEVSSIETTPFYYDKFHHFDKNGKRLPGLHSGPDNKPLIRIDGPYHAPCQVYDTYRDLLLVGSGIGVTPGAAILRSILRYKWRKGFFPDTVKFCWCLRQSEAASFAWFVELLVDLMAQLKMDRESGEVARSHFLEINIYVTGAKKTNEDRVFRASMRQLASTVSRHGLSSLPFNTLRKQLKPRQLLDDSWEQEVSIAGNSLVAEKENLGFTPQDLFNLINKPEVSSVEQEELGHSSGSNKLGDIRVWKGRPVWENIFKHSLNTTARRNENIRDVQRSRRELTPEQYSQLGGTSDRIGVCFCGGKAIGNDLKANVKKWSRKDIRFHLNQEFF